MSMQLIGQRFVQFALRKALPSATRCKKIPMQGGEQPGFYFRPVTQLLAFFCPNVKRLLRQVQGICIAASEAKCESIERLIVFGHDLLKVVQVHSGLVAARASEMRAIHSITGGVATM